MLVWPGGLEASSIRASRSFWRISRSDTFAGLRSRQQRRSGASRPEEENAAGGSVPGDEAAALLRKTVGSGDAGEGRGGAPQAQARPQAGDPRGVDRCAREETANEWRAAG